MAEHRLTAAQKRALKQIEERRHPFSSIRLDVWMRLRDKGLHRGGEITEKGREVLRDA